MAELIEGWTGRDVYATVLSKLVRYGRRQSSRNGDVRNLSDVTICLQQPTDALPTGTGRGVNPRIAAAEALQLIGAFSDPDWLCRIAPQFKRYLEPAEFGPTRYLFHGAYGERIMFAHQLDAAVDRLRETPDTRQAVVTLWDPDLDTEPDHLDYPCTVALGWSVTPDGKLDARTVMRSNDAWLGLPYDLFQFTQLQITLANVLGLTPGRYVHTAWSLHLYEENVEAAVAVHPPSYSEKLPISPIGGIGLYRQSLDTMRRRATLLAYGDTADVELTTSERWYRDVLDGYTANVGRDENLDGAGAGEAEPVQP